MKWRRADSDPPLLHRRDESCSTESEAAFVANRWERIVAERTARPGLFQRLGRRAVAGVGALALSAGLYGASMVPRSASAMDLPDLSTIELAVPAAHVEGVGGSFWTTDLKAMSLVHNIWVPGVGWVYPDVTYHVYAVPDGSVTPVASMTRTLGPRRSEHLQDVVGQYLGLANFSGMLLIDIEQEEGLLNDRMAFHSRTLNTIGDVVVGQGVPPFRQAEALPAGSESFLFTNPSVTDFRTNVFLFPWAPGTFTYELIAENGAILGTGSHTFNAGESYRMLNLLGSHGITDADRAIGLFFTSTAPLSAGTSEIDRRGQQDPTWTPATERYDEQVDILASHVEGANNSLWRTDIAVANPHLEQKGVLLWYYGYGEPLPGGITPPVEPRGGRHVEDILAYLGEQYSGAPFEGSGILRVNPCQGGYVRARTYNETGDGTTGQAIPPLRARYASTLSVLFGLQEDDVARTNVGVSNYYTSNGSGEPQEYRLYVRDGDTRELLGVLLGEMEISQQVQHNRLLAQYGYHGINGMVEFESRAYGHVYASTVQNDGANDPSYQYAASRFPDRLDGLEVAITGPRQVDPILQTAAYVVTVADDRFYHIDQLLVDVDGDGGYDGVLDRQYTYPPPTDYELPSLVQEHFTVTYDGTFSGDLVTMKAKARVQYDNQGTHVTEELEKERPIYVKRVSDLEHSWITDPTRSGDVITYMQNHKQEIANLLSQGNSQCADSAAEYVEFIDIATSFPDIYFGFTDDVNRMAAWSDAAQQGGTMGCVYEAPFDAVLEMVAGYLVDNPFVPMTATSTPAPAPFSQSSTTLIDENYVR